MVCCGRASLSQQSLVERAVTRAGLRLPNPIVANPCRDTTLTVTTEGHNSLLRQRILCRSRDSFPPSQNYVATSNTVVTQGQPSTVTTEKNSVVIQAIRSGRRPFCNIDDHVATQALLCRACAWALLHVHARCAHPGRVVCAAWGLCCDRDFLS